MSIITGTTPFNRQKKTTGHIMRDLLIGLGVIFVAAVIFNFTIGVDYGLKVILMMAVGIFATLLSDVLVAAIRYNKTKDGEFIDYLFGFVKSNYSIITAVIFVLTLPVGTSLYIVIVGSLFATLIVKHVFGGFGHNIFNPAALGRIFVTLVFPSGLTTFLGTDGTVGGITTGPSITTDYANSGTAKWLNGIFDFSRFSMFDVYLGKYSGAIGETFTLLILVVGIVLAFRNVINWRTPVFLFGTVIISTFFIAVFNGVNIGEYILLNIGLGGLAFGAIFMFTDPVTSPTSNLGKALIGIFGGLFNVLFRIGGNMPEGTIFSIALINFISPMIDNFISGRTNVKTWKPYAVAGTSLVLSVAVLTGIGVAKFVADENGDDPDVLEVHAVYHGKSSVLYPLTGNENVKFEVGADVSIDKEYNIIKLELTTPSTVSNGVERVSAEELAPVVAYYENLSVYDFTHMPVVKIGDGDISGNQTTSPQDADYIIPGAYYTSVGIYDAISDAFKHVSVYKGKANIRSATQRLQFNTSVTVAINELNKIDSLIIEEGQTENRLSEEIINDLVTYYTSLTVSEFKALPVPNEDLSSGETVAQTGEHIIPNNILSSAAIYEAMSNALVGYNVYAGVAPEQNVYGRKFSLASEVAVNEKGQIKTINVENVSTEGYKPELVEEAVAYLTNSYTGMDIAAFNKLTAPPLDINTGATSEEVLETAAPSFEGLIYTSYSFYKALESALGNLAVYVGEAAEQMPAQGRKFQTTATIVLDKATLNFTSLVLDEPSTPNWFKNGELEDLVTYYLSLDLPSFLALPAPSFDLNTGLSVEGQDAMEHVMTKGIFSSVAIHEAISNAFSDLEVVTGTADEQEPVRNRKFTTTAFVAVSSDNSVAGLKLIEPSTPNFFRNGEISELINYYLSLDVAAINALVAPAFDLESGPSNEGQKEWDHVIDGGIYTSIAVYEAITRALATL